MNLDDTFYLPRAGRYSNAKSANDPLPLVYGDLTDGSEGIWVLPCIDTVNFVYCYAGHAVQSIAEGNSINIYADGVLVDPANYSFNESIDYEGKGLIATIAFTVDQANTVIAARGKGKVSAGVLMENIIDMVDDFLTVEGGFDPSVFEATFKAQARAKFEAQGYKAAGIIQEDDSFWDIIIEMMGSFLGSAYRNGSGQLVLDIDDGRLI